MQTYKQVRDTIETGDCFFTARKSVFWHLIRFFTQSNVSHVGLFVWIDKRLFCVESTEGKGCVMSLASIRLKKFSIGKTGTKTDKNTIREKCLHTVGRVKYDLIGALLSLLWDTNTAQKFCSEYVTDILDLKFDALSRGIFPSDVANRCGELVKVINIKNVN